GAHAFPLDRRDDLAPLRPPRLVVRAGAGVAERKPEEAGAEAGAVAPQELERDVAADGEAGEDEGLVLRHEVLDVPRDVVREELHRVNLGRGMPRRAASAEIGSKDVHALAEPPLARLLDERVEDAPVDRMRVERDDVHARISGSALGRDPRWVLEDLGE